MKPGLILIPLGLSLMVGAVWLEKRKSAPPRPCTDQDLPGVVSMNVEGAPLDIDFPDGGVCRVAPRDVPNRPQSTGWMARGNKSQGYPFPPSGSFCGYEQYQLDCQFSGDIGTNIHIDFTDGSPGCDIDCDEWGGP